jgi:hypothetical protein
MLVVIAQRDERCRRHWLLLAGIFVALSVDEATALHERTTEPLRDLLGTGGFLYQAWVVPAAAVLVVLGLAYRRWAQQLASATRRRLLFAATLFLAGAFGFEVVGGRIADLHGAYGLAQSLVATVEEGLEMTGLVLLTHALLIEVSARVRAVTIEVEAESADAARPARVLPSDAVRSPSPVSQR